MEKEKKSSIKVLILTHEYGRRITGGLGRVVNGIFKWMPSNIVLDIYQVKFPFPSMIDLTQTYTVEERKFMAYIYRKSDQNRVKCLLNGDYKEVLNEILKRENYDIVHIIVNSSVMAECLKEIKALSQNIKTVYSCHSMAKYEIEIRNNYPDELIHEEYIFNNVDYFHLLNNTSIKYLQKCYTDIAGKKQIFIIPNGIEESDFISIDDSFKNELYKQYDQNKNRFVLCLTRWSFGKGLEYLLDAIPIVVKELKNVKFILAGRKPSSWENNVNEYVRMIDQKIEQVNEYVIPLGWLDNLPRNTVFSIADICVMPSMLEYFPYSILEPMICKVPVISSRIESVEEILKDNQECLFYSPKNPNELAERLIYFLDNQKIRKEIALRAFQKAKEHYNWQTICEKYADMYQNILLNSQNSTDYLKKNDHANLSAINPHTRALIH